MSYILPAEHIGTVRTSSDGWLTIGPPENPDHQIRINLNRDSGHKGLGWDRSGNVEVYVRRESIDLSVIEIHMARHDGIAQEALDEQHRQADSYPLGPKEYWRGEMVGKYRYGLDNHLMTNEEFEEEWHEKEDETD
jgi:hypothetical protein